MLRSTSPGPRWPKRCSEQRALLVVDMDLLAEDGGDGLGTRVTSSSVGPRPPLAIVRSERSQARASTSRSRAGLSPTCETCSRSMPNSGASCEAG